MKNLLRDAKVNNFKDPTKLCLFITYRFGNYVHYRIKVPIIRQPLLLLYVVMDLLFVRIMNNGYIPARVQIGPGLRLPHSGNGIIIHPHVKIGANATIFQQVTIGYKDSPTESFGPPILEDGVYIGAGAKVLGEITLGKNSIVGANAVVLHNVLEDATVVGIPARPVVKKGETKET